MDKTKIAALRKEAGLTQEELAERAYLTVRTIQRAEAGQDVSLDSLNAIANVLNVPVSALFEDIDQPDKEDEIMAYSKEQSIQLRRRSTESSAMWLVLVAVDFFLMSLAGLWIADLKSDDATAFAAILWIPGLLILIALSFYIQRIIWSRHLDHKYPMTVGVKRRGHSDYNRPINNGWEFMARYWWVIFPVGGFLSWLIPSISSSFH
ncbi:helix-turn-helix domain-containing protein [Lactobacillaceae bacterium L1_55_11]|nr:helix-turn-helix domain-containing protein [Lactobacillaceae bacterium L1_55_11]